MASITKNHRYLGIADLSSFNEQFEFNESDIWSTIQTPENKKTVFSPRPLRKSLKKLDLEAVSPRSMPVNIPDWSKILQGEYKERAGYCEDEYEEIDDGNDRIPPHEYLARTRGASFSVHVGIGRTLKGRDLSRVRNAVLKKIGFED